MATTHHDSDEGWPDWADPELRTAPISRDNDLVIEHPGTESAGEQTDSNWPSWDEPAPPVIEAPPVAGPAAAPHATATAVADAPPVQRPVARPQHPAPGAAPAPDAVPAPAPTSDDPEREYFITLHRVQELLRQRDHARAQVEQWRQGTLAACALALVMALIIFWPL